MIGYMYADGGRAHEGYKGKTGDCVCRALAILTGENYRDLYRELSRSNASKGRKRSARNGLHIDAYGPVYEKHGLKRIKLPRGTKPTYSEAHDAYGDCIVHTTKHVASIVDGNLRDTHDERTYEWDYEVRERKAMSVWVKDD